MKLSHLNRTSAKIVHETINKYMKMAAAELGMSVKPSSARFSSVEFSKKIVLVLENPEADAVKAQVAKNNFQAYARSKGFDPELFGKTLVFSTKKLKVVGYTARRYAKPIDLIDVSTGKTYVCRIDHMKLAEIVD